MKHRILLTFAASVLLAQCAWAQYATGFEAPAFSSGTVNGQDSWTSTSPNNARVLTDAEISNELLNAGLIPGTTVHSGSQALLISGAGGSSASIRQVPGLNLEGNIVLDLFARPLGAGTAEAPTGNVFVTMEDSVGVRAAALRFGPSLSIDYGTTVTGIWQESGLSWDPDTWYQFTFDVDYETKTYDFLVNGAQVNTSPIEFYNPTSANFSQIRIFRGSNQAGLIVDDLTVQAVPEPGFAVLVLAALGTLLWRRKH